MLFEQVAALDKIGKAIKLWEAESGTTLGSSGVGYNGQGYGAFIGTSASNGASYRAQSIQHLLTNVGYFNASAHDTNTFSLAGVLLSPCTTLDDPRWVVLATVSPAPQQSVADQIAATGCTSSTITLYSGSTYNRNLIKVY